MKSFDELKKIAMGAAETIADKSYELYKVAEEKTKIAAKDARIRGEITRQKGTLKKLYAELGVQYFDSCAEPPQELEQLFTEISATKDAIEALRSDLDILHCNEECSNEDYEDIEVEIIQEAADEKSGETDVSGESNDPEK